ncbi:MULTISPECIES: hypothetical protein [Chitinophagaceae]
MMRKLFISYPWLFFALAAYVIINDYYKFFRPVNDGFTRYLVPGVLIAFGAMGYFRRWYINRK